LDKLERILRLIVDIDSGHCGGRAGRKVSQKLTMHLSLRWRENPVDAPAQRQPSGTCVAKTRFACTAFVE
jgi:hypothetical protein